MRQDDLQAWLDLPQTRKIRDQWTKALANAEQRLATLTIGDKDVNTFAIETIRLQEKIKILKPLVNDPITALNILEMGLKQVEKETPEYI
jgi:hypothetical protein